MNMRIPLDPRAHAWRLRFLEIAREAAEQALSPAPRRLPGLRPRSRMGGFAAVRGQTRPAA